MDAKIVGGRLRHVMRQLDSFSNGNTHLAAQAPRYDLGANRLHAVAFFSLVMGSTVTLRAWRRAVREFAFEARPAELPCQEPLRWRIYAYRIP
jgi:hypothetical protein